MRYDWIGGFLIRYNMMSMFGCSISEDWLYNQQDFNFFFFLYNVQCYSILSTKNVLQLFII